MPYLPAGVAYIRGQLERGDGTGYLHWQILVTFSKKIRLRGVRKIFGEHHSELTRSEAADEYVFKEATRIEGTQFELGTKPLRRNSSADWEAVWTSAKSGNITDIEPDIRIR